MYDICVFAQFCCKSFCKVSIYAFTRVVTNNFIFCAILNIEILKKNLIINQIVLFNSSLYTICFPTRTLDNRLVHSRFFGFSTGGLNMATKSVKDLLNNCTSTTKGEFLPFTLSIKTFPANNCL